MFPGDKEVEDKRPPAKDGIRHGEQGKASDIYRTLIKPWTMMFTKHGRVQIQVGVYDSPQPLDFIREALLIPLYDEPTKDLRG